MQTRIPLRWLAASATLLLLESACGQGDEPAPLADAPWSQPATHGPSAALQQTADGPILASNGRGQAVLMWRTSREVGGVRGGLGASNTKQFFSMTYRDGHWSSPEALAAESAHDRSDTVDFSVAMDASGNAIAIWFRDGDVLVKRYSAATLAWDANSTSVGTVASDIDSVAQVGMASNGDAFAVWFTGNDYVYAARSVGASWQPPIKLGLAQFVGTGNDGHHWLAVSPSGEAVAAWIASVPVAGEMFNQSQAVTAEFSGGAWTMPRTASQSGVNAQWPVNVALNDAGYAAVAWNVPILGPRTSFQIQRRYAGEWFDVVAPETMHDGQDLLWAAHDGQELLWADDGQGNFWTGWTDEFGPLVRRLNADGTWDPPTRLSSAGFLTALSSDIQSGRPMAMWIGGSEMTSSSSQIFTRAMLENGSWGNAVRAGEAMALVGGATLSKTGPDRAVGAAVYYFKDAVDRSGLIWTNDYN